MTTTKPTPMYTKMTATGSSLIVNPRTITKDLETKIAASIAGVIAKTDVAQLTTKFVRQAVEKDIHVSLTSHKELLKRLMHQEFRKAKAAKAAKRVVPEAWKSKERRAAIRKGLNFVFTALRDDAALFAQLGVRAIQALYELERVAAGDVQPLAALHARLLGALWLKREAPLLPAQAADWAPGAAAAGAPLSPARVLDTVRALFVLERLGLAHPLRVPLLDFFARAPPAFGAESYFGWDPATGVPPSDAEGTSFAKLANALLGAYVAHSVGVSLGASVEQLFGLVQTMYPLKAPTELSGGEYRDQALLATTVVAVATKFGTLRCEPELLPHEYFFLRHHLVYHLSRQDVALVGDSLRALKSFDGAESLVQVRRGMAFLLQAQRADGAWASALAPDAADAHFATLGAALALAEVHPVGFAPSLPALAPLLEAHLNVGLSDVLQSASVSAEASKSSATSSSSSSSSTATEAMDTGASGDDLQAQVLFLQGMLEKDGGNVKSVSAALATHVVSTLGGLPLTVEILKSTGVGRVINKLRKHASPEVAKSATQLVAKWKKDLL